MSRPTARSTRRSWLEIAITKRDADRLRQSSGPDTSRSAARLNSSENNYLPTLCCFWWSMTTHAKLLHTRCIVKISSSTTDVYLHPHRPPNSSDSSTASLMSSNSSTASDSSNVAAPANSSPDQLQATSTATALIDNSLSALWRLMLEQMPKHAATMGELGCISALVHGWRSL